MSLIKIIHQTAADINKISPPFDSFVDSVKRTHPTWKYMFWSDQDNFKIVHDHYSDMLEVYNKVSPVQKSDIARYCILHKYGGLYIDIDIYCNKSLEPLIKPDKVMLAPSSPLFIFGKKSYTNYIMYSSKNHPFWLSVLNRVKSRGKKKWRISTNYKVSSTTGNLLLNKIVKKHKDVVEAFKDPDIYDLHCQHDLDVLKERDDISAFHYGGTSRPQNNWSGGLSRFMVNLECELKKLFGIRPNSYQLPIITISFILIILLCISILIVIVVKRKSLK